jgi:hypothetical protein
MLHPKPVLHYLHVAMTGIDTIPTSKSVTVHRNLYLWVFFIRPVVVSGNQ